MSSSEARSSPDQRGQDLLWGPCSCPPPSARVFLLSSSSRPAGSSSASTPNLPCSWCVPQILVRVLSPAGFSHLSSSFLSQDAALSNRTLVGPVLGCSVANLSLSNLTENIEFTIRNINPTQASCFFPELRRVGFKKKKIMPRLRSQSRPVASCAFWDFSLNGEWMGFIKSQNGGTHSPSSLFLLRWRRRLELSRLLPGQRHAASHHLQLQPSHVFRHPAGRRLRSCPNKQRY